jgi:serine/threonine protein kinase
MLWFDVERDIQLQCLQPIPAHVPGISMVEAAHEPVHQGVSADVSLRVPKRLAFDHPETGEQISSNYMELSQTTLEPQLEKEPTSCLGKRTRNSGRATIHGPFPCLSCTKQCQTIAYWRDHQTRVHFSEKIFECWENKMDGSPCLYGPVLRADNLRTHLAKEHGYRKDQELRTMVNDRARIVLNLHHDKCGFTSCRIDLPDFKTSMDHIAEHLSSGLTILEWIHDCQKNHRIPPHSKQNGCPNTMQSSGHDDDDDDDDNDDDDQGDNDNGHGDDQQGHALGSGSQRSHGFSRGRNQGTQNTARKNQAQESHEGSEVVINLSDYYSDSHSPQLTTPSADGMATDIAIQSIGGAWVGRNVKPFPGRQHLNLDSYFRRIRFLGRGSLGFVENVVSVASNKIYARKTIRRCQISFEDLAEVESLNEELEILKSLRHANLVRLIDVYTCGDLIYIFMSPVADGNLASFFHATQDGRLSQNPTKQKYLLLEWMSCLQSAVWYLHSQNVVHEDLKPENILVKENTIFLTNVKDLKQFARQESVNVAKPRARSIYCAPETMVYGIIDAKSNTFSLGCVFAEMLTLHFDKPLSDFTNFRACEVGDLPYHSSLERTNTWIDLLIANLLLPDSSLDYGSLFMAVHDMLIEDSAERPSTCEIRLGVKELLQEMAIWESPSGPAVPDIPLDVYELPPKMIAENSSERPTVPEIPLDLCEIPQEMITEKSSERLSVPEIHLSTEESSQDMIIQTVSNIACGPKWDWASHMPRMAELYNRGQTIPQIHKAVQCDTFRPR